MKNNDLLTAFKSQLKELASESADFKIALSGGLDSVVLLHLFSRLDNTKLTAHHIHHGLSDNADGWASFCKRLSANLKVECAVTKVTLDKQSRTSLEALARNKRYEALKENFPENGFLVTAHHQDDQLETVLLALKRGAGLTGLQGIVAKQTIEKGHLIRPLLDFSREQLEAYALQFKLKWIEDESNNDQGFDRNFIRHNITPLLKSRWPSIGKTVARSASHCQSQQLLIDDISKQDFQLCQSMGATLSIVLLNELSATRRNNVLRCWFKQAQLNYPSSKQLKALWENVALAKIDAEPQLLLQGNTVCRYEAQLYLFDKRNLTSEKNSFVWQGEERVTLCAGRIQLKIEAQAQLLNSEKKVEICFRRHLVTDLMCLPMGRNKRRSVKKLLHEYHIPPWLRESVPFVLIDGVLVEAVGVFQCDVDVANLIKASII